MVFVEIVQIGLSLYVDLIDRIMDIIIFNICIFFGLFNLCGCGGGGVIIIVVV